SDNIMINEIFERAFGRRGGAVPPTVTRIGSSPEEAGTSPTSTMGPRRFRLADYAVLPRPRKPLRRVLRPIARIACWLYVAGVLALYGAVRWASPEWWMTHLLFFCPRWFVSVPTLLLVPLAVRMRLRPEAVALAAAVILFVFEIWGFNVPYRNLVP